MTVESPHFMLFLAGDFSRVGADIAHVVIREAVARGAIWVQFWGPGAERMEQVFGEVRTEIDPLGKDDADGYLICLGHEDYFADRLAFFLHSSRPSPRYLETCRARLAVAVDAPHWHSELHRFLSDPSQLDAITEEHLLTDTGPYGAPPDDPSV